jgi:hypothetical protein
MQQGLWMSCCQEQRKDENGRILESQPSVVEKLP